MFKNICLLWNVSGPTWDMFMFSLQPHHWKFKTFPILRLTYLFILYIIRCILLLSFLWCFGKQMLSFKLIERRPITRLWNSINVTFHIVHWTSDIYKGMYTNFSAFSALSNIECPEYLDVKTNIRKERVTFRGQMPFDKPWKLSNDAKFRFTVCAS